MILEANTENLVSVIIPTYNKADTIMRAIESVRAQSFKNHEIIVVDDGSTDNTKEILRDLPDVRYFYRENAGPAAARNLGVRHASAKLIAFLDSDDEWHPDKLAKCVEALLETPKARVVISNYTIYDDEKKEEIKPPRRLRHYTPLRILVSFNETNLHTSSVVTHKIVFDSVGGFDERFIRGEDWELWIRFSEIAEFFYIDEPLVKVHIHPDSLTKRSVDQWQYVVRTSIDKALARKPMIYYMWRNVIFSAYHLKHGMLLYNQFNIRQARAEFFNSYQSAFNLKALYYFLKCFLGARVIGLFRKK